MRKSLIICLMASAVFVGGCRRKPSAASYSPPAKPQKAAETLSGFDPTKADARKVFIQKLLDADVLREVGPYGKVVIGKKFVGDFNDKQKIISAVMAYRIDGEPSATTLTIYEPTNGKKIGVFSTTLGLQFD